MRLKTWALCLGAGLLPPLVAHAQVGVGTPTPDAKAALEIKASDKGLLIPRLTASQRMGITNPPQGLMVYQTDGTAGGGAQTGFWYYAGTGGWVFIEPGASGLTLPYSGTASTSSAAFAVSNTGTGPALTGTGSGTTTAAVQGINNSTATSAIGVQGTTASGYGVIGAASGTNGYGVEGRATDSRGVNGFSVSGQGLYGNSTTGIAVQGVKSTGDKGRAAQFTSSDAANDSTALYVSTSGDRPALRAVNTATSAQAAIRGVKQSASTDGIGVEGVITSGASGNAAGVRGTDQSGSGGSSGVVGLTAGGYGVRGIASASGGYGVSGSATNSYGVIGSSASGVGVYGSSSSGYGVQATSGSVAAVYGTASTGSSGAIVGINNSTGGSTAAGVLGLAQDGWGVRGVALTTGMGVSGQSPDSYGVSGVSGTGSGVYGRTGAGNVGGVAGVIGSSANSSGVGVLGTTVSGYGVRGEATGSSGYGVIGVASSTNGIGVIGSATGAATGVIGQASGTGRAGYFNQNSSSGTANALEVQNSSLGRTAYFNQSNAANAANALEVNSVGFGSGLKITHPVAFNSGATLGLVVTDPVGDHTVSMRSEYITVATASTGEYTQTFGGHTSMNSNSSQCLVAFAGGTDPSFGAIQSAAYSGAKAAKFEGPVQVIGTLSKSGGSFQIDHPLDPANQYLYHSFVESPDMMNVYNGNITLDARGEATVQLPDWFEALNRDFRYQLTPIGAAFTPYVKEKVAGNKFRIAGQPGAEVSWQVTGIRHDRWAEANRIPVEQAKEAANRGKYLHPTLFGQPIERGIGHLEPSSMMHPTAPGN